MRYAKMRVMDVNNGPGFRASLFVQGCNFHCDGCFNQETWDYKGGHPFDDMAKRSFLNAIQPRDIVGASILGGEPLSQGPELLQLLAEIKETYPKKTIWMWTGYTWEEIINSDLIAYMEHVDVLVDGKYDKTKPCPHDRFKGSFNQRIIDVKKTMNTGKITLYNTEF